MEPQIRYARTRDGVDIACYAAGSGPAIVFEGVPFSHLIMELRNPATAQSYEAGARIATVVRFDHRGFGLSERAVSDFTLEAFVMDLEAVVERLELDRFALFAFTASSPTALQYAAKHPDRVTRLVLYPGFTRPEGLSWNMWWSLAPLAVDDWEHVSKAMVRSAIGFDTEESFLEADLLRSSVTPETLAKYLEGARTWDASPFVRQVVTPTLLVQPSDARYASAESARRLLSELPDGRLLSLEGSTFEQQAETWSAIFEFIGLTPSDDNVTKTAVPPSGTAIILVADIADHTAHTVQIGDAAFREKARPLDEALRSAVRDHGGTVVDGKTLGDGILATFPAASQAIAAALVLEAAAAPTGLGLHIGLHAGDVLREVDADGRSNVFGSAVSIASRISALAPPGEILVSRTVADLARSSIAGVTFEDRGEHALKGIAEPQRVFAVRPEGA
jgi:class 3 adenylate cyclase/pimeloyl-ACP methyl ester carboxylesterase